MKRALFIDRDGTIIAEPDNFQVDSFAKLRFISGAITNLARIAKSSDYELVMVSNQDGLGTDTFPDDAFYPVHDLILQTLAGEGVVFDDVLIDRSFAEEDKPTRKPGTGMLTKYSGGEYDLARSFVIGDRPTDVQLAANLGSRAVYLKNPLFPLDQMNADFVSVVESWDEIYETVCRQERVVEHRRRTSETDFTVVLNLDGCGRASISTGIAFFDHMLEQLARHAGLDLSISGTGDLHIDEHHTVEDVAIALGQAFEMALGDKRGLDRYGFLLPMDDCLAQAAIDLGGRSWIVWQAEFKREKIGGMPTEMFFHFFKSFTDHAKCSLHIKADGTNEHHKIEAIFKAFARSIRSAIRREGCEIPSTKGVV